jgi:dephospho-CoA kinase
MKIIGLTGGIGSGKSTVASILKELGATVIDLDKIGHEMLDPGTPAWLEVVEAFGQEIISTHGTIDRQKLARIVFNDPEALRELNRITHPKIDREVQCRLKKLREQKVDLVVLEAALIEAVSWAPQADQIWLIQASRETTLCRLKARGMRESESLARIASQHPPEESIKNRMVIINNNGTMEDLKTRVVKLWKPLHNKDRR